MPSRLPHRNAVCRGSAQAALRAWEAILVDDAMIEIIHSLRASGMQCCLATNQQQYRARHMSETLGYRDVFDQEFYSCELGYMKPETGYFEAIVTETALPPSDMLFIDDREVNVTAARQVGLKASVFQTDWDANRHAVLRHLLAQYDVHVD